MNNKKMKIIIITLLSLLLNGCSISSIEKVVTRNEMVDLEKTQRLLYFSSSLNVESDNMMMLDITTYSPFLIQENVIVSLDIYPKNNPSHPDRHYGFWNVSLDKPSDINKLLFKVEPVRKNITLYLDGKELNTTHWIGEISSEETYVMNLVLFSEQAPNQRSVLTVGEFIIQNDSWSLVKKEELRKKVNF
ncbi:hypothetical protein [Paenibacillus turpanensis]|uniref:hypothetical protein n=1 Tax=Paenibacillus turpanensis TaxID=2689078 RepID=UPI00140D8FDF|nr:hypothetical protein [Paenibacillus turpanensis]